MAPAIAASSCRFLLSRQRLKRALTEWFWISCQRTNVSFASSPQESRKTHRCKLPLGRLCEDVDKRVYRIRILEDIESRREHRQVLDRLEEGSEELRDKHADGLDKSCVRACMST